VSAALFLTSEPELFIQTNSSEDELLPSFHCRDFFRSYLMLENRGSSYPGAQEQPPDRLEYPVATYAQFRRRCLRLKNKQLSLKRSSVVYQSSNPRKAGSNEA